MFAAKKTAVHRLRSTYRESRHSLHPGRMNERGKKHEIIYFCTAWRAVTFSLQHYKRHRRRAEMCCSCSSDNNQRHVVCFLLPRGGRHVACRTAGAQPREERFSKCVTNLQQRWPSLLTLVPHSVKKNSGFNILASQATIVRILFTTTSILRGKVLQPDLISPTSAPK